MTGELLLLRAKTKDYERVTHCEVIFTGPQTSSRRQHICKSLSSIPSMDFTTSCHQTLLLLLFSSHSPFFPSIEELACGFYRIHINLLTRPPESQGWKSTTHVWQKEWSNTHIRKKQKQKPKRVKAGRSIRKLHKKKKGGNWRLLFHSKQ